jgi:hypothetical protein
VTLGQIRYMRREFLKYRLRAQRCSLSQDPLPGVALRPSCTGTFDWSPTSMLLFEEIMTPGIRVTVKLVRIQPDRYRVRH